MEHPLDFHIITFEGRGIHEMSCFTPPIFSSNNKWWKHYTVGVTYTIRNGPKPDV